MSLSAISSFIHQFNCMRGLEPAVEDEQGVLTLQVEADVLLSLRAGPDDGQITIFSSPGYVKPAAQARGQGDDDDDDDDDDQDERQPTADVDPESSRWDVEVDERSRLLTLSRHCDIDSLDAASFATLIDAYVFIYRLWETQLSAEPVDLDDPTHALALPPLWPLEGLA